MAQPFASIPEPLRARRNAGGTIVVGGVCVINLSSVGFDTADNALLVRLPDEDGESLVFINASGKEISDNTIFYVRQAEGLFSALVDEGSPTPGQIYGVVSGQTFMTHGGLGFVCVARLAENLALLKQHDGVFAIKGTAAASGGTITVKVIDSAEAVQGSELTLVSF